MGPRVVGIIQQRMGSTRLHDKAMLPLAGKPTTQWVIERAKRSKRVDQWVLATPSHSRNVPLWALASTCNIDVSKPKVKESNLVRRFGITAERYHADLVVRLPADNPCVDPDYIDSLVDEYLTKQPSIFRTNTTAWVPSHGLWIDGIGAEISSIHAWRWLQTAAVTRELREHPHKAWNVELVPYDYSVDIDTPEDYEMLKTLFAALPENFTSEELASCLMRLMPVPERGVALSLAMSSTVSK